MIQQSLQWLKNDVFPLWISNGIDPTCGGFFESLNFEGRPGSENRRALVQARQIYSFTEAVKLNVISKEIAVPIVQQATNNLLMLYGNEDGSFCHAVNEAGTITQPQCELYTQAFVLFSLARAFELLSSIELKLRAKKLLSYLYAERRHSQGGFTEIKPEGVLYQSNPHMHLFEAAIEWCKIDSDGEWKSLSAEIFLLAKDKFIDAKTNLLAEHFTSDWKPQRENNIFVFEPGHQYEWAWLMLQYSKFSHENSGEIPATLFSLAEKYGVNSLTGFALDEVDSDFKIKKSSSRFWPQTERVKAAVELGCKAAKSEQMLFAKSADQAMRALSMYLQTPRPGLWFDTRLDNGTFSAQPAKASSLYHFISAISEYTKLRSQLPESIN